MWPNRWGFRNGTEHMAKADEEREERRTAPTFEARTKRARAEADALEEELERIRRRAPE